MSIAGFDRRSFEKALKQTLSPTTPIRSAEFLRGRDKKLEDIRRAVIQPGRHIFIYGDRGVGKTSTTREGLLVRRDDHRQKDSADEAALPASGRLCVVSSDPAPSRECGRRP